ncbi:MAG: DMSO/selenate family reductase complex A subunit [Flaviflexus sp.]|uniref:DMSO/selenate family reductase complex A subunit n=1 Tax=Flaviflexus sp. TaxID=1969482 RepID=UPI003F9245FB
MTVQISNSGLSRRSFMKWSGVAGGTTALVATAAHLGMPGTAPAYAADGMEGVDSTVWNACTVNCGSRCPLRLQVKDGVVVRVLPDNTGDDADFGNHNILACIRGRTMRQRIYSPDRLKKPMRRVAGTKRGEGEFEEISWETAFDEIAERMKSTIDNYGNDALYINNGTGTTGGNILHRRLLWRFMDAAGGSLQPLRNYSNAAYIVAGTYQHGASIGTNSTEDAANSNLLVMFGANLIETRMSGGGEMYSYQHLKETHGTRIIVIDPRYSETALTIADEWVPIRPGTDTALVAALVNVMVKEGLQDQEFLDKYCVGFDEDTLPDSAEENSSYRAYVEGKGPDGIEKTPEWASDITGIPASRIRALAREIGSTKPCAISSGWGMQRQAAGENQSRAVFTLAAVTGNIGISGGGNGAWPTSYAMPVPNFPDLDKPITVGIPVFKWSDAVDHGEEFTAEKDGVEGAERLVNPIKFMINYAGQCIMNQHADPARITEILQDENKLETLVVIDTHLTPTAKMADYLLPDAMSIEQPDLIKNENSAETGYAIYAQPAIQPPGDAMRVYDMCTEILERVNPEFAQKFTEGKTQEQWVSSLYEQARDDMPELPSEEEFKELGVIRQRNPDGFTIPMKEFRDDPEANPLKTPSGKIEIYSERLAEMSKTWVFPEGLAGQKVTAVPEHIDAWEGALEARESGEFPLQCINHHTKGRTHSTYWEQPWSKEAHPQKVWINPADAEKRGITMDDPVRVKGNRGALDSKAFVTPRIAPGVISVPQGAWYTPNDEGIDEGACASTLASLVSSNIAKGNTQQSIIANIKKLG